MIALLGRGDNYWLERQAESKVIITCQSANGNRLLPFLSTFSIMYSFTCGSLSSIGDPPLTTSGLNKVCVVNKNPTCFQLKFRKYASSLTMWNVT